MEVHLTGKKTSKSILDLCDLKWKLHSKNIKKLLIIFGLLALVSLTMGFFNLGNYTMINVIEKKIYFNLNLFFSLAVSFLFFCLYFLNMYRKSKKVFFESAKSLAEAYGNLEGGRILFGEEYVEKEDGLASNRVHWKLFKYVFYHDGFALLAFTNNPLDSLEIDLNMMSKKDQEETKKILAERIM